MSARDPDSVILKGSCVALGANAVLLVGPSGSGKSSTALWLLALGCRLISDDGTALTRHGDMLVASGPDAIKGQIEARGVGILAVEAAERAVLKLVVDLGAEEKVRLPPFRETEILGCTLPLVHGRANRDLPAVIFQYLKGGRTA